jgi:hypothetical protein
VALKSIFGLDSCHKEVFAMHVLSAQLQWLDAIVNETVCSSKHLLEIHHASSTRIKSSGDTYILECMKYTLVGLG